MFPGFTKVKRGSAVLEYASIAERLVEGKKPKTSTLKYLGRVKSDEDRERYQKIFYEYREHIRHKYITLVYDMINKGVEYIAYDRKKGSLDEYYNTLTKEELSKIDAVSMDMWDPFMLSTKEHVPDASSKIVFDRFHVMKHVNDAVDKTRKEENRKVKENGIMDLSGSRYMWLYSEDNLPERNRERYNLTSRIFITINF